MIKQSPSLDGYSLRHCAEIQEEVSSRLGDPGRLELRLLIEFCVATWRCALDEWLPTCTPGELPECVLRAFATMDDGMRLAA